MTDPDFREIERERDERLAEEAGEASMPWTECRDCGASYPQHDEPIMCRDCGSFNVGRRA